MNKFKTVVVVCADRDDFREWKHLKGHANYISGTHSKYQVNDTIYRCVRGVTDLCSVSIDEIVETEHAIKNPEYEEIMRVARINLNPPIKEKKMITILKGYIPYGTHKTKGNLYFSASRQKWVNDVMKLKFKDFLSTPTVPIVDPKKVMKKIIEVGVAKIEINVDDI